MAIAAGAGQPLPGPPLTWSDLQRLPEDGSRHELVDGELLVTPAPVPLHQRIVLRLASLLDQVAPPGYEVFAAPIDWYVSPTTVFEPDVIVVPAASVGARCLEGTPLLAVEVLSPTTRHRDVGLKRRAYAEAGLGWYWVVDPAVPRLTAYRLVDGHLVEQATVADDAPYDTEDPVKAQVVPRLLVEPR
jgi:Uma2 family endonuclease